MPPDSKAIPSVSPLRWLLAELTYACPLQCPYCSNPINYSGIKSELTTQDWKRVLSEAREMGAVQLGLSGGEPLVRKDLVKIVEHARALGYYSNLITSGNGLSLAKIRELKTAGLDHIQISIQASDATLNDYIAGTDCFEDKLRVAGWIKETGYPMVLCVVIHRQNIHQMQNLLEMATELNADYLELANTQYYGWAKLNRNYLLPTREQVESSERIAQAYKEKQGVKGKMKIYYVVPDYYGERPKACTNGWGSTFLTVAPDGMALPCHAARELPGLKFPYVNDNSISEIWNRSAAFNQYRGDDWMQEPCRSCAEKELDFGGCRCQAYLLTGDATNADPVCSKSPHHGIIDRAIASAASFGKPDSSEEVFFRNSRNSKSLQGS